MQTLSYRTARTSDPRYRELTPDLVLALRRDHDAGVERAELEARYRLSGEQVAGLLEGQAWSWVGFYVEGVLYGSDHPGEEKSAQQRYEEAAFWAKVDRSGGHSACWPGIGGWELESGHRATTFRGRTQGMHRIAWMLGHRASLLPGWGVLHACGNAPCCNPGHLRPGTKQENAEDLQAHRGAGWPAPLVVEVPECDWGIPPEPLPELLRLARLERLASWVRVEEREDGQECWIWQRSVDPDGYGYTHRGGKPVKAHRLSWELANDEPVPAGLSILHSCDVPACVNPEHLRAGTAAENTADAVERGQHPRGARHGMAKLTEEIVAEARRQYSEGRRDSRELAAEHNVDHSIMWDALRGWGWKHVDEECVEPRFPHRLDETGVLEIRERYSEGASLAELAQEYECSATAIHNAATGKTHGHLPGATRGRSGRREAVEISSDALMRRLQLTRLAETVDTSSATGCWEIRKTSSSSQLEIHGSCDTVARWMWRLSREEAVPAGRNIQRSCRNSRCVRPDHLSISGHPVRSDLAAFMATFRTLTPEDAQAAQRVLAVRELREESRLDENGCWLWATSTKVPVAAVRRRSWVYTHGELEEGHRVQRCAYAEECINPDHTIPRAPLPPTEPTGPRLGEAKPNVVLTDAIVTAARRAARQRESVPKIAERLGVPLPALKAAVNGTTWKHLEEPPVKLGRGALDDEEVAELRQAFAAGVATSVLCERYEMRSPTIFRIGYGQSYPKLPGAVTPEERAAAVAAE